MRRAVHWRRRAAFGGSSPWRRSCGRGSAQHYRMRLPDVHGARAVFSAAGRLWVVPSHGGVACQLTDGGDVDYFARFSPDGEWIAFPRITFTGPHSSHAAVVVIPASGGVPRQLTFYPSSLTRDPSSSPCRRSLTSHDGLERAGSAPDVAWRRGVFPLRSRRQVQIFSIRRETSRIDSVAKFEDWDVQWPSVGPGQSCLSVGHGSTR